MPGYKDCPGSIRLHLHYLVDFNCCINMQFLIQFYLHRAVLPQHFLLQFKSITFLLATKITRLYKSLLAEKCTRQFNTDYVVCYVLCVVSNSNNIQLIYNIGLWINILTCIPLLWKRLISSEWCDNIECKFCIVPHYYNIKLS